MGERIEVSRRINAPAEKVWAMVSDITRMGEWSPESTGGSWLDGASGPVPGATFTGSNRKGLARWSTRCTVTDADPGRKFAFDVSFLVVPISRWAYDIAPDGEGCVVTESWVDRRPPVVGVIAGLPLGVLNRARYNRSGMESTLEALAAAAERPG